MTENKPLINDERRASGFASLSSTILPFAKSILGKKGFVEIDILAGWSKIVGDELASWSVPQKIDFKKAAGPAEYCTSACRPAPLPSKSSTAKSLFSKR